ncbi:hypothetical protein P1X14_08260 [Sphingomonas sp. AOB5]|uniref:hypothetical protein n=1 Tax=Sphingomonas sp. AOB5 TaxID=3034017 RepID=UPI0023F895B1|nr:hypothetical protein [Sphingomonas sp. AOB5]MDF7775236.1 hypothetical protein [Sphingomonas sp. AOB5]
MARWFLALFLMLAAAMPAHAAECRKVGDVDGKSGKPNFLKIDPVDAAKLAEIGIDRAMIFAAMVETSMPETGGCWAGPSGNFDGQVISVGMSQWNFGTGSLQPLLKSWRSRFATNAAFVNARNTLAPAFGELLFSDGCLAATISTACRNGLLAGQDAAGKLGPVLKAELVALFETDLMLQVQTDTFVKLLRSVQADLARVFPSGPITARKIKWAIDTKVQQGGFPADADLLRVRLKMINQTPEQRTARLKALVRWYQAIGETIDQDGIVYDLAWNAQRWTCMIDKGLVDEEQHELLTLTFLRSRTATGNGGRWQALTFQRRAKIILGVGSIGGTRTGDCIA